MFAVLETGGKQYRVAKGEVIRVEKLEGAVGEKLTIDKVLLISDEAMVTTGKPFIAGSSIQITILDQDRAKKIRVFKMKQRKRYRRTQGHRQYYSKIRIDQIVLPSGN